MCWQLNYTIFSFCDSQLVACSKPQQKMGRTLLPHLHPLLAHSFSRHCCPFQALRGFFFPFNFFTSIYLWFKQKTNIVNRGTWQNFTELEYLLLGLVSAVPSFLIPMLLVGKVCSLKYLIQNMDGVFFFVCVCACVTWYTYHIYCNLWIEAETNMYLLLPLCPTLCYSYYT